MFIVKSCSSKLYSGYDFVIATGSDIGSTSNIRGYGYDCYIYGFLSHHKSSQKLGNGTTQPFSGLDDTELLSACYWQF